MTAVLAAGRGGYKRSSFCDPTYFLHIPGSGNITKITEVLTHESRDWEIKNKTHGKPCYVIVLREVSDDGWQGEVRRIDDMSKDVDCIRDEHRLPC